MSGRRAGPNFLIVGAARSGTTSLATALRSHSQVFVTDPKEPHYFAFHGMDPLGFRGPGDATTINRVAVTERAAYMGLFSGSEGHAAAGDASVSSLYYHERAISEILRLNDRMRIIILLREPVERANSAFDYMTARGFETAPDLIAAVADEPRRVAANWHHLWHYTRMGLYADSVEAFISAFGRDRVGVWFHDEMSADYPAMLREVLRFLGAGADERQSLDIPVVNVSGTPRSGLAQSVVHFATSNGVLRRTGKRLLSFERREQIRRGMLRPHAVDDRIRRQLEPLFTEDLEQLSALLADRPQPHWLRAR